MKKQSPKKQNTTQRGYGYTHQQARKRLIHNHKDGTPCQYCGQPMYRDKHKNWDGYTLEADHEIRQKDTTNKRRNLPTRLLHKTCNSLDGARAQWGLPHTHHHNHQNQNQNTKDSNGNNKQNLKPQVRTPKKY